MPHRPQHKDRIVTIDYCDVTSLYVYRRFALRQIVPVKFLVRLNHLDTYIRTQYVKPSFTVLNITHGSKRASSMPATPFRHILFLVHYINDPVILKHTGLSP